MIFYPHFCTYLIERAGFLVQCGTETKHRVAGSPRCRTHVGKWEITDAGLYGPGYWPISFDEDINARDLILPPRS